ncbi:MAG TPA: hypothetical protein VFK41_07925 [Nocardioidaceae bacterium]|nr:hypothetical protein [Nocardioidaceae bacterium]
MVPAHLLSSYLNDHLAAATASVALFERTTQNFRDTPWADELRFLTEDVTADREAWLRAMETLGVGASRAKQVVGLVGERLGRFKPNGSLFHRTPMTDLVELEGLRIAVATKINALQVLRAIAVQDPRLAKETVETLLERAQDQAERLYRLHLQVAQELSVAA